MTRSATRATLAPLVATALALATIAALAFVSISGDRAEAGTTHTVFVNNSVFCESAGSSCAQPYSIQIDAGDTVQWSDGQSGVLHTVTQCSGDGAGCPDSGGFDSGFLTDPPGGYLTQAFPDEGTFFYRCQVHRNSMRGIVTVGSSATPTASATPSPTPSPTATATAAPTATPTPTTSPTATATAAPALSGRSDVNCDGETDGDDVLALLLHTANLPVTAAPASENVCAAIGSGDSGGLKGDLNCDGLVDARDALVALYGWAGLPVPGLPSGCLGP